MFVGSVQNGNLVKNVSAFCAIDCTIWLAALAFVLHEKGINSI
jgi:hypothetical protein